MYDLALRGYDALHAVHGEYYEVQAVSCSGRPFSLFNFDIFQCKVGCIPCVLYTAAGTSLDWALGVAHIPYVYRYFTFHEFDLFLRWDHCVQYQCVWNSHNAMTRILDPLCLYSVRV